MNWLYEYISDLMNALVVILFRGNRGSAMHTHSQYFQLRALKPSCFSNLFFETSN